jgi:hypothetical protein
VAAEREINLGLYPALGSRDWSHEKVQPHWWPEYSWEKFFWFNTGYFVIMIASVVAHDLRGGGWIILPLAWAVERLCNGFWHLWWNDPLL